jgi:hypothetical protein
MFGMGCKFVATAPISPSPLVGEGREGGEPHALRQLITPLRAPMARVLPHKEGAGSADA